MKFYDASNPLYLEAETSGIALGTGLLQVREGMNSGQDEVPENTVLYPTAFESKDLCSPEQWYSNIE